MLRGNATSLRARQESDVAILQAELYDDVATRSRADSRPWRPLPLAASPYQLADNVAMLKAAAAAGFVREGTLSRSAWLDGDFADEVVLGLLSTEWNASRPDV